MDVLYCQNLNSASAPKVKKVNSLAAELQKAIDLSNKGETEKAIPILKKLVSKRPKWVEAHRVLAATYHKAGEIDAAVTEFKTVIKLEPKNPENYFTLGMLYRCLEKNDLAITNLERALKLEATNLKYKKHLAESYYSRAYGRYSSLEVSQESWEKMISDLERAVELDPKNEDAHLLLGQINEEVAGEWKSQKNDAQAKIYYEIAESEYLKVLELNPKSKVEFSLAKVCFGLGKYQLAHKYLSQYLKHSQDSEAQKLMREIEFKLKEKGE